MKSKCVDKHAMREMEGRRLSGDEKEGEQQRRSGREGKIESLSVMVASFHVRWFSYGRDLDGAWKMVHITHEITDDTSNYNTDSHDEPITSCGVPFTSICIKYTSEKSRMLRIEFHCFITPEIFYLLRNLSLVRFLHCQ